MNELISHIEFLLHTHNCVIVPGLGGFVVNTTSCRRNGLSTFHSPAAELVFNRELSHNDGLLVESYMRTEGISFETASQKIEESVRQIKSKLREEKVADLNDLGSFEMIDGERFMYLSKPFVRPDFFGLSDASLKPVIQIQPKALVIEKPENKKSVIRKIGIGAAAAAVIAAIMLVFPVQDSALHHQTARIFSESEFFGNNPNKAKETAPTAATPQTLSQTVSSEITENFSATNAPAEDITAISDAPVYYIVVGVYEVRKVADDMIASLQSDGFSHASTLERPGRIDVYSSSYSSREEAERKLKELKQDFPKHRNAWVLKR